MDLDPAGRRALVTGGSRGIGKADAAGVAAAEIERKMAHRNLTRTLIDASQVAAVITFLASPLAVSVNGESIACGGGTPGVIRY